MPFNIHEWFGYGLNDRSPEANDARKAGYCRFIEGNCDKTFNDGSLSGVCSVLVGRDPDTRSPVAICPNRVYENSYAVLGQVADAAFGSGHRLIRPERFAHVDHDGKFVVALGKRRGGEIRLPSRGGRGAYFVDWILARISPAGELAEFAAVEVQTIDTIGTYRPEVERLRVDASDVGPSKAGLNWENVNKRILIQLIYKGHVLRREPLCKKGMFFICPSQVYERIITRLGSNLLAYDNLQPGSITFMHFSLAPSQTAPLSLRIDGTFSTTIDQVATAFTSPTNLPDPGVYETAIRTALTPP